MKELKNDRVTVGDGTSILAEKIGDKNITILQEDGEERDVVLRGCKYVPKLGPFSLFSLTNSIDKGFKLGNEGKNITIRKRDFKLKFDRIINTKSGYVCGVATKTKKNYDVVNYTLEKSSSVDVNHFHQLLGHLGEVKTREIAKYYGIKLTGKYKPCPDCVKGKAKQANVPKGIPEEKRSRIPGERFFLDISSVKTRSLGGSKFWLLLVDDATGFKFSYFNLFYL